MWLAPSTLKFDKRSKAKVALHLSRYVASRMGTPLLGRGEGTAAGGCASPPGRGTRASCRCRSGRWRRSCAPPATPASTAPGWAAARRCPAGPAAGGGPHRSLRPPKGSQAGGKRVESRGAPTPILLGGRPPPPPTTHPQGSGILFIQPWGVRREKIRTTFALLNWMVSRKPTQEKEEKIVRGGGAAKDSGTSKCSGFQWDQICFWPNREGTE